MRFARGHAHAHAHDTRNGATSHRWWLSGDVPVRGRQRAMIYLVTDHVGRTHPVFVRIDVHQPGFTLQIQIHPSNSNKLPWNPERREARPIPRRSDMSPHLLRRMYEHVHPEGLRVPPRPSVARVWISDIEHHAGYEEC